MTESVEFNSEFQMEVSCDSCHNFLTIDHKWEHDELKVYVEPCETCTNAQYNQGYSEGHEEGYDEGYDDGSTP